MDEKDLTICKQEMKILTLELELRLKTQQAILEEKTKRLETVIYFVISSTVAQLIGLVLLWLIKYL